MTDDRILELWDAHIRKWVEIDKTLISPIVFARAIEAECRGVPDYVWMIGTKGFMALFATEEAANDWQQMNGTNTPASYIQPVSIPVISAAPKPEKAEPDCECGAVASEHCPACEPVAQEPTAFLIEGFNGKGKRIAAVIQQNADNARNSASVFAEHYPSVKTSGLYLAPPDQSAEVSMTPAASIFKDEVARLNAEVERLREILSAQVSQAESQQTVYRNRIAELEATIEAQRTLYANCIKISHEADELEHKCHRLERQQKVLVEAMEKLARLGNGEHYGNSEGNCIAIAALVSVKGNAEVNGGRLADRPSEAV